MKKDCRGFKYYSEFKDSYKNTITVKQSSSAEREAVWIFCKNRFGRDVEPCIGANGGHISVSPHLTKAQARRLAKVLLRFADE